MQWNTVHENTVWPRKQICAITLWKLGLFKVIQQDDQHLSNIAKLNVSCWMRWTLWDLCWLRCFVSSFELKLLETFMWFQRRSKIIIYILLMVFGPTYRIPLKGALSFVTKCFFWSHLMPTRRCSSSSVRSVRNVLLSWLSGFHIMIIMYPKILEWGNLSWCPQKQKNVYVKTRKVANITLNAKLDLN